MLVRHPMMMAPFVVLLLVSCTPSVTPRSERIRVAGLVRGSDSSLLEVEVYERCSPRFYFFERCPGRLLGGTRIAKPGPFLVAINPSSADVSIFAFRGSAPREHTCAAQTVAVDRLSEPLELTLADGPCALARPASPSSTTAYAPSGGRTSPGGMTGRPTGGLGRPTMRRLW